MNNNNNNNGGWSWVVKVGVLGAAAAAGAYWLGTSASSLFRSNSHHTDGQASPQSFNNFSDNSLRYEMETSDTAQNNTNDAQSSEVKNINSLLLYIYKKYIALKKDDLALHYNVFVSVFYELHNYMKDVDPYYLRYSSKVDFSGSHSDGLKIEKPDEFDIDVVIRLPLNMNKNSVVNESDIVLIAKSPGFVELKMGQQFAKLPDRDNNDWKVNKTAYFWKDDSNFLCQTKFCNWFKGVVNKALNKFEVNGKKLCIIRGVPYTIRTSESIPAITLIIENTSRSFRLDVDVVPSLRFPESRWPISKAYRSIPPDFKKDYWLLVPKLNKSAFNNCDKSRSWRISLHEQEKEIIHDCKNLKMGIKFLKKLRDVQGLDKIASYYIKTLFLWEATERDKSFWTKSSPDIIFKTMLIKFHKALEEGKIPYYWNKNNNLIGDIDKGLLKGYANKLTKLIKILEEKEKFKEVAKYLLTTIEYDECKRSLCL